MVGSTLIEPTTTILLSLSVARRLLFRRAYSRPAQAASAAHLKPVLPVEESGVFLLLAPTR